MSDNVKVTGVPETNRALVEVGKFDVDKAGQSAAEAVLPEVKKLTRVSSGLMVNSWQVDGPAFINNVDYSTYQEFGTAYVRPAFAVVEAWYANDERVVEAFEKEIDNAISKAGFDTR